MRINNADVKSAVLFSDGSKVFAVTATNKIYTSTNGGLNWTQINGFNNITPSYLWLDGISNDSSKLFVHPGIDSFYK